MPQLHLERKDLKKKRKALIKADFKLKPLGRGGMLNVVKKMYMPLLFAREGLSHDLIWGISCLM